MIFGGIKKEEEQLHAEPGLLPLEHAKAVKQCAMHSELFQAYTLFGESFLEVQSPLAGLAHTLKAEKASFKVLEELEHMAAVEKTMAPCCATPSRKSPGTADTCNKY